MMSSLELWEVHQYPCSLGVGVTQKPAVRRLPAESIRDHDDEAFGGAPEEGSVMYVGRPLRVSTRPLGWPLCRWPVAQSSQGRVAIVRPRDPEY